MKALLAGELRRLFNYDKETGEFTRLVPTKRLPGGAVHGVGSVAGSLHVSRGYVTICIAGKVYFAHRLAFLWVNGEAPSSELHVDHINGVRSDNRWVNLRLASPGENLQNQKGPRTNNSCGLLGVRWKAHAGKWSAQIAVKGEVSNLGHFDTKESAYAAYLEAKRRLHPFSTL